MSKPISPINSKALIALAQREKLFKDSLSLATKLYKKQKRAYSGAEYASHPMTAISVLMDFNQSVETLSAAALEEVLVRTSLKESSLREVAGPVVTEKVLLLTPPKAEDGKLDVATYAAQLAGSPADVQNIKLASMLDHICSIPRAKLGAEYVFLDECAALLPALTQADAELKHRTEFALRRARA